VHKRRQLVLARQLEAEQQQVEARVEAALAGQRTGSSGSLEAGRGAGAAAAGAAVDAGTASHRHQGRPAKKQPRVALPNHYDRGAWRNLSEVLFPEFHLRQAAAAAAAAANGCSSPAGGKKRA